MAGEKDNFNNLRESFDGAPKLKPQPPLTSPQHRDFRGSVDGFGGLRPKAPTPPEKKK